MIIIYRFVSTGDPKQLSSVLDVNLDSTPKETHDPMTKEALEIVSNAHYKFELKTNMRQSGDVTFQQILTNIRNGRVSENDVTLLETRLDTNLDPNELNSFIDATHIFATNKFAENWNEIYLSQKPIAIKVVPPVLTPECEFCAREYYGCFLGKGVSASITRNLCPVKNVVNGSECTVEELFYENDHDPLPTFVTVHVKNYSGATLDDKTIPIPCVTERAFCPHSESFYEIKFIPLRTNYGLTVFKAQSRTIEKIWVNFTGFKFQDKAIYSSLSRCVSLNNVVIRSPIPLRDYFFQ